MTEREDTGFGVGSPARIALAASASLRDTLQGIKVASSRVRDLTYETQALNEVLSRLVNVADDRLPTLTGPLQQCAQACEGFKRRLDDCMVHNGEIGRSSSFWRDFRYNKDSVGNFQLLLAIYKSTIHIVLTGLYMDNYTNTAETIDSYRCEILDTINDIEDRFCVLDKNRNSIPAPTGETVDLDSSDIKYIRADRLAVEICHQICTQQLEAVEMLQPRQDTQAGKRQTDRISCVDIYSSGDDNIVVCVSTDEQHFDGRTRVIGDRTQAYGGRITDNSLEKMIQVNANIVGHDFDSKTKPPRSHSSSFSNPKEEYAQASSLWRPPRVDGQIIFNVASRITAPESSASGGSTAMRTLIGKSRLKAEAGNTARHKTSRDRRDGVQEADDGPNR